MTSPRPGPIFHCKMLSEQDETPRCKIKASLFLFFNDIWFDHYTFLDGYLVHLMNKSHFEYGRDQQNLGSPRKVFLVFSARVGRKIGVPRVKRGPLGE